MNIKKVSGLVIVMLIASIAIFTGCVEEGAEEVVVTEGEKYAKDGDTVKVHYTGTLDDGTVFESSIGRDPLQFTVGDGSMIQGFDRAVNGMMLGEKKTVTIPADEAYGPYRNHRLAGEDLTFVIELVEIV